MRSAVLFGLLLLAGCSNDNCAAVNKAEHWLTDDVTTREQLRQEINDVLVDNRCDGITAAKLRKILLDMEKLK